MTKIQPDTIAAVATPAGRGGIGVIRISGPETTTIARTVLGHVPSARHAELLSFRGDGQQTIDTGIALFFAAPHSFTGEDVLELQGHGGPVVMDMLLQRIIETGARLARPGEFSERAFLNNKIDLAQAEAIADLIDSVSTQAVRSATRSLEGEFSTQIHSLVDALTQLRIYVESAIDFPEEEIDFLSQGDVGDRLHTIISKLESAIAAAEQGRLLREGMTIVITGRPNVGKSSLLNILAQRDTAIVTDIPGTTRDVLREQIMIDGLPLHIIDTAGLRDSNDPVESQGIRRAHNEIEKADRILFIVDDSDETDEDKHHLEWLKHQSVPVTVIRNKIDLTHKEPALNTHDHDVEILLSAKQGSGLELLNRHLKQSVGFETNNEGSFIARRRHLDALHRAHSCLIKGQKQLLENKAGELLAEDLKQTQNILSEITGEVSSDDLLGEIFSQFCIGK